MLKREIRGVSRVVEHRTVNHFGVQHHRGQTSWGILKLCAELSGSFATRRMNSTKYLSITNNPTKTIEIARKIAPRTSLIGHKTDWVQQARLSSQLYLDPKDCPICRGPATALRCVLHSGKQNHTVQVVIPDLWPKFRQFEAIDIGKGSFHVLILSGRE